MPRNFPFRFLDIMKLLVKWGSKGRFAPAFGDIGSHSELVQDRFVASRNLTSRFCDQEQKIDVKVSCNKNANVL